MSPETKLTSDQMAICDALSYAMRKAKKERKLTYHKVAEEIGTTYDVLNNMANKRTAPDMEIIERVRLKLELPKGWPLHAPTEAGSRLFSPRGTKMAPVKIAGAASAGPPNFYVDYDAGEIWVPERLAQLGPVAKIVEGSSMWPWLHDGDAVIFKEQREPKSGYAHLVRDSEGSDRIKIVAWKAGRYELQSFNPIHQPESMEGVQILGLLMGFFRMRGSRETIDSDPGGLYPEYELLEIMKHSAQIA